MKPCIWCLEIILLLAPTYWPNVGYKICISTNPLNPQNISGGAGLKPSFPHILKKINPKSATSKSLIPRPAKLNVTGLPKNSKF